MSSNDHETRVVFEYSEKQEDIFFNWPDGVKFKIITKGRRASFTHGAALAVIDEMIQGLGPFLWVDTIGANIQRYFDRYFLPCLNKNDIPFTWNVVGKQLSINGQYCDFRSEDQGDGIEGFGYRKIILNEAGIILKNRKLYVESILPMLTDFADSKLIAGGVPKGKKTKDGKDHLFYDLYKRCQSDPATYMHHKLTAFDNPWVDDASVKALEQEMYALGGQNKVDQEVYGLFVDKTSDLPFLINFDRVRHVGETKLDINKTLYLSIDFNLRPFCCSAYHKWRDEAGDHIHKVDEFDIPTGSISKMIDEIKLRYLPWLPNCRLTGDRNGKKKELSQDDNASNFLQIQRGLRLRDSQIIVPANPTHVNSGSNFNYLLYHHPDFKYGKHCENSIFDAENVEQDPYGNIIKGDRGEANQRADYLDTDRYFVNTFCMDWIDAHQKRHK